jgi:hypothetical protein
LIGSFWLQITGRWLLAAISNEGIRFGALIEEPNSVKFVLAELLNEESMTLINSSLFF